MRKLQCMACNVEHERADDSTWHQDQCNDCIVRWAYDKAVRDADKVITDGCHADSVIQWHTKVVAGWKTEMLQRGLLT